MRTVNGGDDVQDTIVTIVMESFLTDPSSIIHHALPVRNFLGLLKSSDNYSTLHKRSLVRHWLLLSYVMAKFLDNNISKIGWRRRRDGSTVGIEIQAGLQKQRKSIQRVVVARAVRTVITTG
jgi:hypothetical protein